jgi:Fe-S-cluster-containing dehydrogenase component
MDKWNLIVDIARCNNCASCTLASLDEHIGNDFPGYAAPQDKDGQPWLVIRRHVRGEGEQVDIAYMPTMCNHCDNAACGAGKDEAVIKRADGIVLIDPVKAKGRRDLIRKCPYGAIHWNEVLKLPQIWIFDAHLLDAGWRQPRCQQVCASGAIRAIKVSDKEMLGLASKEGLQVNRPEFGTLPRVHYKNLHRMLSRFVAGTVRSVRNGIEDCISGCKVELWCYGKKLAEVETDWFGDFKFDGLDPDDIECELIVHHLGHEVQTIKFATNVNGKNIGVVKLKSVAETTRGGFN